MRKNGTDVGERILYNPENVNQMVDWMGYEINSDNHIQQEYNEQVPDTAVITEDGYKVLSQVRGQDKELYENWINLFDIIDRVVIDSIPDESIWSCITELKFLTDASVKQLPDERKSAKK